MSKFDVSIGELLENGTFQLTIDVNRLSEIKLEA